MALLNSYVTAGSVLRTLDQSIGYRQRGGGNRSGEETETAGALVQNSFNLQNLAISAANLDVFPQDPHDEHGGRPRGVVTTTPRLSSDSTRTDDSSTTDNEQNRLANVRFVIDDFSEIAEAATDYDEDRDSGKGEDSHANSPSAVEQGTSGGGRIRYILLNVGGTHFRISRKKLIFRCPMGRLAKLVQCSGNRSDRLHFCDDYLEDTGEYYFERPANVFYYIYNFYATGDLHRAPDVCHEQYMKELKYWNIPHLLIPKCCRKADVRYATALEAAESQSRVEQRLKSLQPTDGGTDDFTRLCCGKWRRSVWMITEHPGYNRYSKAFTLASVFFVAVSISVLILGSIPDLQDSSGTYLPFDLLSGGYNVRAKTLDGQNATSPHPRVELQVVEIISNVWFTLEYATRFMVAPHKLVFMKQTMNIVDLAAMLPFYAELILAMFGMSLDSAAAHAFAAIRVIKVLRVIRIFKLARYSEGLQAFIVTLKRSLRQLGLMVMLLGMCVLFFSTLVFYMETEEEGSKFDSIPSAFWWCLVTMTTVGYGDIVPVTIMGRLIGSGAILLGTLVVALPITVIVENFQRTQTSMRRRSTRKNKLLKRSNRPSVASVNSGMLPNDSFLENGQRHKQIERQNSQS